MCGGGFLQRAKQQPLLPTVCFVPVKAGILLFWALKPVMRGQGRLGLGCMLRSLWLSEGLSK